MRIVKFGKNISIFILFVNFFACKPDRYSAPRASPISSLVALESPCQELSNDTRLDIRSARGAEYRPKLFPIMCVILRTNRIANFEFANLESNFLKVGLKNPESKRTFSQLRNERLRSLRQLCDFLTFF